MPIPDFRWCWARLKINQMIATTTDWQKLQDWREKRPYCNFRLSVVVEIAQGQFLWAGRGRKPIVCHKNCHPVCHSSKYISISGFCGHIATSSCRSLSQSPGFSFFALGVVENPRFAVGIVIISVIVPDILVFPVLVATFPYPVVGRRHNRSVSVSSLWAWSKPPGLPSELQWYLSYCRRYNYFPFGWSHCYFWLSVNIALFVGTFFEFGVVDNFVYRARWRPITTSGFVRHLENVQILLLTLLPSHLTILVSNTPKISHLWSYVLASWAYNAGGCKSSLSCGRYRIKPAT